MNRPNIVVIYADDLGAGDVSCFGSEDIPTPNIDRIAASGIRLENWYSNSPVCSPSRAALLTGRHPAHAGVQEILGGKRGVEGLPEQSTLASLLKEAGYATGIFGKWHLGTSDDCSPLRRGFDTHFGFRAGCVDYYSHIFYWGQGNDPVHDLWRDDDEVWLNGRYLTEVIAEEACEFIRTHAVAPFLCCVPFNAPHYPMHAPKEYLDRFKHLPSQRRIMAAMISAMDDGVGRLLDTLASEGLSEDTLVFFSSDNGPSTESRNFLGGEEISYEGGSTGGLRGHKGSLFEGGIKEPAVCCYPGKIAAGSVQSEPGMMMDVLPTILAACGVEAPADLDGVSHWQSWSGGSEPAEARTLTWEYGPQLAARRDQWKFLVYPREFLGGPYCYREALFDLHADPAEEHDVLAQNRQVADSLRTELMAWAAGFDWDPSPWLDEG